MNNRVKTRALLVADFSRMRPELRFTWWRFIATSLANPGLVAVFGLRVQQALVVRSHYRLAGIVRSWVCGRTGADFVPGCSAGPGLLIHHPNGIVFGAGARLGANCTVLQQVTLGERYADGTGDHGYPVIGSEVTLSAGVRILGGVTVGDGCVVGANAVVLRDLPPGGVAVGVPARLASLATARDTGASDATERS